MSKAIILPKKLFDKLNRPQDLKDKQKAIKKARKDLKKAGFVL